MFNPIRPFLEDRLGFFMQKLLYQNRRKQDDKRAT